MFSLLKRKKSKDTVKREWEFQLTFEGSVSLYQEVTGRDYCFHDHSDYRHFEFRDSRFCGYTLQFPQRFLGATWRLYLFKNLFYLFHSVETTD
jgi:hypothetical protein